ncbi:MAG: small basic protein [Candidatus Omnitrophota bacterium]
MTQHSSLKKGGESKFRSVLKRFERLKELADKEKWFEEKDSIYKLPKLKIIKFKVKKVKAAEEEVAPAEAAAAGAEGAASAKKAAPGKEALGKGAAPAEGGAPAGEKKQKAKK